MLKKILFVILLVTVIRDNPCQYDPHPSLGFPIYNPAEFDDNCFEKYPNFWECNQCGLADGVMKSF